MHHEKKPQTTNNQTTKLYYLNTTLCSLLLRKNIQFQPKICKKPPLPICVIITVHTGWSYQHSNQFYRLYKHFNKINKICEIFTFSCSDFSLLTNLHGLSQVEMKCCTLMAYTLQ